MNHEQMTAKIATGEGFIAALDQSGGSTPKALRGYGVEDGEWSGDDEMFAQIHAMRSRVITAPCFGEGNVIGAILFEKTMDGEVDGKPTADALKERGIVPFIKVDQGLSDEVDGAQMMKPLDKLPALLEKSVAKGMFGTKMRSVISAANADGIAAIVGQQFEIGKQILSHGLMPILEPEVTISIDDKAEAEAMLLAEITRHLDTLPDDQQVMLKLTLPEQPNIYEPLVDHPKVLKIVALSGGYDRAEANRRLAENAGIIASFSRALTEGLSAQQTDEEFNATLSDTIDAIYAASVAG